MGSFLLSAVSTTWARLLIAAMFFFPAAAAGFHATQGIVNHTMPCQTWQMVFSILGAAAVGIVAFVRITGRKAFGPSDGHSSAP